MADQVAEVLDAGTAGGQDGHERVRPRFNVGKDGAEPVTDDYPGDAPWRFTGGTIVRAAVDVSGEPFVDLAAEARMAFMRD